MSKKTGKNIECKICKKEFYVKKCLLAYSKYCSAKCRIEYTKTIPVWNKGLTKETDKRINYERPGVFKKGHPAPITAFKKGRINPPKGLGNKTPYNHKMRMRLEYKDWHRKCLERDNFTCQKTGKRGGVLEVHHILNYSQHPELRLEVLNGITLSKESHRLFHKTYGQTNNTIEQLEEFIGRHLDGTLNTITVTYPDLSTVTKTLVWSSGELQSITVV